MIVGTAGHIDHGKTSLVQALTGIDTDRLKEEKARGISIDLGFAYLPVPDGDRLGFVDVPGHERFVHTMLAGAGSIDWALLVVAADDGPMLQTLEHLAILDLLGIANGMVALTKTDLVAPERLAAVSAQIRDALTPTGLAGIAIVPVSARTGAGIEALRNALFAAARSHADRNAEGLFRLAVDRSFVLSGAGTVVTGTILSGSVAVGDRVMVSPSGVPARVRAIHAQNQPVERSRAGDRCALNLAGEGIARDAIHRGDVVCDPSLHAPTARLDAQVKLLPGEKAIPAWMPVRLHHAATSVGARLVVLEAGPLEPGATGPVQLVLDTPIAAAVGDRFVLRDVSAQRTLGGGRFLDLRPPSRRRRAPERLAQLAAAAAETPAAALAGLLALPPYHLDLVAFGRDRTLTPDRVERLATDLSLVRLTVPDGTIALAPAAWGALSDDLVGRLAAFHAENPDLMGIGQERLRLSLDVRLTAPVFRAMLQEMARAGHLVLDGAWVRLPGHTATLSEVDEIRWRRIPSLIGGAERFRPPRVRDIAKIMGVAEADIRHLLKRASRLGRVDEVAHDHFFLRTTTSEMVDRVASLSATLPKGEFTASQFRDTVENGRKVAIQILEFFDRHGVTLRREDLRRVNPQRLDLFRIRSAG
ncbi:selenocysteine-specific translation elongation factor [Methylobacterium sp. BTF04]|uniref:selenocysteine-specific translation elongation factor n=1 Tax=Methylobacterium sp. BTF04 TaxID=2708300 RepID=UPI0013D0F904|nr:selenocysteine-specific translation elongation factor [Methylobacterium sp. BTF04]NEU13273.1 selenocysteine-specific translation elongation factor [Methylobacterium sp. BTF04]